MARDVEFNVTASDKTGMALAAAEANFRKTNDKIKRESDKTGDAIGKGLAGGVAKAAPGIVGSVTEMFSSVAASSGPLLVAGVAAAAPLIGATLSAAIIGGAGIGGVVGGVALAARDPRVQAEFANMTKGLSERLEHAAEPFVGETIKGIGKIEAALDTIDFEQIFADSADFVDPLVDGVSHFITSVGDGIEDLVHNAGPVIDALGNGVAEIGDAIGDAFTTISGEADGAAVAVDDLSNATGDAIRGLGELVANLTMVYGWYDKINEKVKEWTGVDISGLINPLEGLLGPLLGIDDANKRITGSGTFAQDALTLEAQAAVTTGSAMLTLAERINQVYNANRSIFDAQTNTAAAFDSLTASIEANGRTLDVNSEKGRANRQALSQLAQALNASYQAYAEVNGEGAKANGIARSNYDSFVKAAQGLGISEQAAQDYARKLGLIPPKKDTAFHANTHDAEARVAALQDKINDVKGKTVTVTVNLQVKGSLNKAGLGKLGPQAGNNFSAGDYWGAVDVQRGGTSRTGGPTPVSVTNDVAVSLDGAPFYAMTARAVERSADRQAWRTKVGRR